MENTEERNVNEWKYYIFYVYKRFFGNYTIYTALMDTLGEMISIDVGQMPNKMNFLCIADLL